VPGTGHELVPGSPSSVVVCIGGRRVAITDPEQVAAIADALNALKLIQQGAEFDCTLFTEPIGALFFTYTDGDLLAVELGGPCNTVSNGTRSAFLGHTVKHIRRLAVSG